MSQTRSTAENDELLLVDEGDYGYLLCGKGDVILGVTSDVEGEDDKEGDGLKSES